MRNVRQWTRDYESHLAPLAKKLESLRGILDNKLPKAISFLLQTQHILDAYREPGAPRDVTGPPAPADPPPPLP